MTESKKPSPKQQAYIDAYCETLNQAAACRKAGYSAARGTALMKMPHIQQAIREQHAPRLARAELSTDIVLEEVRRIVTFSLADVFDDEGNLIPLKKLPPEVHSAIGSIEFETIWEKRGKSRRRVQVLKKIKAHNKIEGLNLAMRHLGLLRDTLEIKGTIEHQIRQMTDEELQAEIRKTLAELGEDAVLVLMPARKEDAA